MTATHKYTSLKSLLAVSMCAGSVAFAGEEYVAPAPAPAPPPPPMWNWFAGASIGYLLDSETEAYHGHIGVDFHSDGNLTHSGFLEIGYAEGLENQSVRQLLGTWGGGTGVGPATAVFDGEVEVIPVTLNYKLEGCFTGNFGWYIGAGLGVTFIDADYSSAITGNFAPIGRRFSDDDVVFTGQVFAGVVWEASETFEVYSGLRYIYVDDPEFSDTFTGAVLDVELDDYMAELGFRFNF